MKALFDAVAVYMKSCKWQDMALLKICLCAVGIMIGLSVPKKHKMKFWVIAPLVFLVTYVPLMLKFLRAYQEAAGVKEL